MPGRTARFVALGVFLALLLITNAWEMQTLRRDGERRLQQDAASLAKRTSLLLAGITWAMDAPAARNAIFVEMEDLRLAGMLIHGREELLEGMRRNSLWEPVPWDDLMPENSVEASAPIIMEDVPVGEVVIYLSRRALNEEFAAKARREFVRLAVLALIPCIGMALLLWQRIAHRAAGGTESCNASFMPSPLFASLYKDAPYAEEKQTVPPTPLQLPPDWHSENVRRAYLESCDAFIRNQYNSAALLCLLTAREDWGELREAARALREAALAINAGPLAAAALSLQEAALANTASAARRVEHCIHALIRLFTTIEHVLRDNDAYTRGDNACIIQIKPSTIT